jgi:hypothetical protein
MKTKKVQVRYRLKGYPIKYKTKTMKMEIPTNEFGFTLVQTLNKNIMSHLQQNDENYNNLLWHRVV